MHKILIIALLFVAKSSFAQKLDLDQIRKDFNKGVKSEELCEGHLEALEKYAKTPEEKGYHAAYHMFMASHTGNPFKKMGYFKHGKKLLEDVISKTPQNVELRFIRLCIQFYIPKYLNYHDKIEEDKAYVMNNLYKMQDEEVKDLIFNYLKGAKMYTSEELALLGR
ncbi:hypothetical protein [Sphingobacterium sp. SYP-B4668]|uniref:hypothetical protein n=1 Tax=Sphingobacterium sp. SYP-B4668 TaxID=2996035 RepID=UPI0005326603|nr:hypothetical protein [Sphingobacterium sp. SYP-B4668]